MGMKYTHTNINTPDWKRLSDFYQKVFNCKFVPPLRNLYGEWFERATGVKGAHVEGIHLALPGYEEGGPTIEIFTHVNKGGVGPLKINENGFAHMAILVDNVEETYKQLVAEGGSACGEIVSNYYESIGKTLTLVYAKDPDGNIIEIQNWS